MELRMTASEIEQLIERPEAKTKVEELQPGRARIRVPYQDWMLRPGNVIGGPSLFMVADMAMFVVIMGHLGAGALGSVTTNVSINFLNRGQPGDIVAEATLLKLGKRLAVIEVRLMCADSSDVAAFAIGHCMLPAR